MAEYRDMKPQMRVSVKYVASTILRVGVILLMLTWINVGNAIEHEGEVQDSITSGVWATVFIVVVMEFLILLVIGSEIETIESKEEKKEEPKEKNETETSEDG